MLFNLIGQPRFNGLLVRMFGMKIAGAAAPTLSPEIAPSIDVNQMDDAAMAFLRGEKLAGWAQTVAASVGNYSVGQLRNPAGSGQLIVVEQLQIGTNNVNFGILATTTDLASTDTAFARDTRWRDAAGSLQALGRVSYQNSSAVAPSDWRIGRNVASATDPIPLDVVIAPGYALVWYPIVQNSGISWSVQWRERALPAEETNTG